MRTDQMLREANRKRDLAQQIRVQAESMMRDSLHASALRRAEKLDAEAPGLETVVRATQRVPPMSTARHMLEMARSRRNKAYCLLRDAPSMPLAKDRARLIQYAKFFEEEAVKLEARASDPITGPSDRAPSLVARALKPPSSRRRA